MILFIMGLFIGGFVGVAFACFFAQRNVAWNQQQREWCEKLICELAKHFPCKLWAQLPPWVQDGSMKIIEQSYRKEL